MLEGSVHAGDKLGSTTSKQGRRRSEGRSGKRTMILVSSPASRRSFSIFAASNSGLVPFITRVPSPIGTANIVVAVNTLIARGLPRVPRTIHRHVELFSQIQDIVFAVRSPT